MISAGVDTKLLPLKMGENPLWTKINNFDIFIQVFTRYLWGIPIIKEK